MKHLVIFVFSLLASTKLIAMDSFRAANRPYNVQSYRIQLELDPMKAKEQFGAINRVVLSPTANFDHLTFDSEDLDIKKVVLINPQRAELKFEFNDAKELEVQLPRVMTPKDTLIIDFTYQGKIHASQNGLFRVTDPDEPERGPLFFTHFEPIAARSFFPCNDEPSDKAMSEVVVTVPVDYQVISNGRILSDKAVKKGIEKWHEVTWRLDKPHPTYLVSLAVGRFKKVTTHHKGKEVTAYVGNTKAAKVEYLLTATKKSMDFFEKYLGVPYPWAKYASVGLPTFVWGGMENTSATFMNQERVVLDTPSSDLEKQGIVGLSAHELAHQWFGDLVTMKWWTDVWLNESFASYFSTLATTRFFNTEQANIDLVSETWNDYFRQEDGPRSHAIVTPTLGTPDEAFDAINYTKGENVLRMLNYFVGEANFKKGVTAYLQKHAYDNANYRDFFAAMEKASKMDLTDFRDTWLLQRGYPVITFSGTYSAELKNYKLTLLQRTNITAENNRFRFKLPLAFHRRSAPAYDKNFFVEMTDFSHELHYDLPAEPEWITMNPGGIALSRFEMVNRDEAVLGKQALQDPDTVGRLWAAFELISPLLEGKSMTPLAQKPIAKFLESDPSPYARIALMAALHRTKSRTYPKAIGDALVNVTQSTLKAQFVSSQAYKSDPHGWRQWRSTLYGALGKVEGDATFPLLEKIVLKPDVELDDLGQAARAMAMTGKPAASAALRAALVLHGQRGYPFYQFAVTYAYGAYENPAAAKEIERIVESCGADLMARLGRLIVDNQTLKNSPEWAEFLREFTLKNTRFGDEIKSRVLRTVEEVKAQPTQQALETIQRDSNSPRIKEVTKKILEKNFYGVAG